MKNQGSESTMTLVLVVNKMSVPSQEQDINSSDFNPIDKRTYGSLTMPLK